MRISTLHHCYSTKRHSSSVVVVSWVIGCFFFLCDSGTAWIHYEGAAYWRHGVAPMQQRRQQIPPRTTTCFYRPPNKETFNVSDISATTTTTETDETTTTSSSSMPSYQGTLGDIMSPRTGNDELLFQDGLVTSEAYSLAKVYEIHNPLDRMAITANGNLQRLFSSYYDAPVQVTVDYCRKGQLDDDDEEDAEHDGVVGASVWDRCVHLSVWNQTFCTAISKVIVHDYECQRLVESGQVGIGQLFRFLNILPEFALVAAGPSTRNDELEEEEYGGFWRNYTLTSSMVSCSIHETFCPHVWELKPVGTKNNDNDYDVGINGDNNKMQ